MIAPIPFKGFSVRTFFYHLNSLSILEGCVMFENSVRDRMTTVFHLLENFLQFLQLPKTN